MSATCDDNRSKVAPDLVASWIADEVAYEPVGLSLEHRGLATPGVNLRVAEDGDVVFACVPPEGATSCGFGRVPG